jgi:ribosomal protein S18 acetylase RimI-like enzyme
MSNYNQELNPNQQENNFIVRKMTKDDLKIALSWAEKEGWNPGINDVDNFYIADEGGFLIGELNGNPISCISVVRYNENFNFIGLYIVKPEYRKQGYGLKTWEEAFKLIPHQGAALDGVLQQVSNYEKFGFKSAHSHLRYRGIIEGKIAEDVVDLKTVDFEKLCHFDSQYFPCYRGNFLQQWINQAEGKGYAILSKEGDILGYGVIRKASEGFKIAPLFSTNKIIAEKLLLALSTYANGANIYLDVPSINQEAISLVESYQMQSMFECVRMYTSVKPNLNWEHIFGVTSLEIG